MPCPHRRQADSLHPSDRQAGGNICHGRGLSDFEKRPLPTRFRRGWSRAVRLLHSRAWSSRPKGAHRPEPRPDARRGGLCHPQQYLPLHGYVKINRRYPASAAKIFTRGENSGKKGKRLSGWLACTASMSPKKVQDCGKYPMTSMLTAACAMAARCAPVPKRPRAQIHRRKGACASGRVRAVLTADDIPGSNLVGHIQARPVYACARGRSDTTWAMQLRWLWQTTRGDAGKGKEACQGRL